MDLEHRISELEHRCRRLQTTIWAVVAVVVVGFTVGMSQTQQQNDGQTQGGYTYSNTIHRVELVQTRDNMGKLGWLRGGRINVSVDSNFANELRAKPLKVNLTNRSGFPIDK